MMSTSFPHLQQQIGQDLWVPGAGDSTSSTLHPGGITASRTERTSNFLDLQENLAPSPPHYAQACRAHRHEITRGSSQPVVNNNLMDLNDIRHDEMASHIHMNGRLETVPHYPVFLEAPARYPTRPRSRSPASIASSSTTTALISVGQLPGSELFDPSSPPMNMYQNYSSSTSPPVMQHHTYPPDSVRTEATISGPLVTQPASTGEHTASVSQISWFWDDLSQEYWKPPDRGYYAPETRSDFRHTIHLSNKLDSRGQDPSCRSFQRYDLQNLDHLPPPPKDPRYEAHPRNNGRNRCLDRLRSVPLRRRKDR